MADWGQPDYDASEDASIDYISLWKRIREDDAEAMIEWPHEGPAGYDHATVRRCCVDTSDKGVAAWQRLRLSMKGIPTHRKLDYLKDWFDSEGRNQGNSTEAVEVQVYNYLGALRRGGQLNAKNQIRKYI